MNLKLFSVITELLDTVTAAGNTLPPSLQEGKESIFIKHRLGVLTP